MIHSVIDRKRRELSQTASDASRTRDNSRGNDRALTELAGFQSVKRRQPAKTLARLFIEPRQIERLIAENPRPSKASDARILAMLERYLAAVEYAGATLEWTDSGIVLETVETLDRSKLEPWLLRWADNDLRPDATLARVPATTIAVASGHVDAPAFYEALCQIVPDEDQPKLKNLETLLGGLLLGQDLRTRILPRLGPGLIAYVEAPPDVLDASPSETAPPAASSRPSLRCSSQVCEIAALRRQKPFPAREGPQPRPQSKTPSHRAFIGGARRETEQRPVTDHDPLGRRCQRDDTRFSHPFRIRPGRCWLSIDRGYVG